jgi:hypothetical protein
MRATGTSIAAPVWQESPGGGQPTTTAKTLPTTSPRSRSGSPIDGLRGMEKGDRARGAGGLTSRQADLSNLMRAGFRVKPQAIQKANDDALKAAIAESLKPPPMRADAMTNHQARILGAMHAGLRVSPQAIQVADDNALAAAIQESLKQSSPATSHDFNSPPPLPPRPPQASAMPTPPASPARPAASPSHGQHIPASLLAGSRPFSPAPSNSRPSSLSSDTSSVYSNLSLDHPPLQSTTSFATSVASSRPLRHDSTTSVPSNKPSPQSSAPKAIDEKRSVRAQIGKAFSFLNPLSKRNKERREYWNTLTEKPSYSSDSVDRRRARMERDEHYYPSSASSLTTEEGAGYGEGRFDRR